MSEPGIIQGETHPHRVLIADDKPDVLTSLQLLLKTAGYETEREASPAAVLAAVRNRSFDVVLMDLNYVRGSTSGTEGLDMLLSIRELDASLPVVVMTAWGSIELAVEAMRRGAKDFVEKPWDNERLLSILRAQIQLGSAIREAKRLEQGNRLLREEGRIGLVAESEAMRPVLQLISRVAPSDANVLITGENGSGKGVVAQMLHELSRRAGRQMVSVNIGGLPEGVFESELFGHVKGAFTDAKSDRVGRFEIANGGTLFLDEIANMSPNMQARLLRVIETGQFEPVGSSRTQRTDVRVVSATNADLEKEVSGGRFRRDLLYRLNTLEIRVPPLRARRQDIPLLAMHFLRESGRRYRKQVSRFDNDAMQMLLDYQWPGNVRELDHVVERAVLMSDAEEIRPSDLGFRSASQADRQLDDMSLEEVERFLIKKALSRFGGNVSQTADFLGLSRSALYRRLEKHGL